MVRPKLPQPWEEQSNSFCIICSVLALRVQSSANKKALMTVSFAFVTVFRCLRYSILTIREGSWKALVRMAENTILKSVGETTQPWLTPLVTGKASDSSPSSRPLTIPLSDDRYEPDWTAKLLHYLPQAVYAHRIEGLGQVNYGHEEDAMLLTAFFLELAWSKYHVGNSTIWAETTLGVWEVACEQALCLEKKMARKGKGPSSPLDKRPVHRLSGR